jgi:AraC-like DNA-binding protein
MDTRDRRVLDLRKDGLDEIPVLGWFRYANSRRDLPLHCHHETVEICYLVRGTRLFVVEGRNHELRGGDVLVTLPDVMHSTAGLPSESCILCWINIHLPKPDQSLLSLPASEGDSLVRALLGLPRLHFPGNLAIKAAFDRLLSLHGRADDELQRPRMRQAILELLLEVIQCSREDAPEVPQFMTDVTRLIQAQPEADFRLEELARRAGYSLSRFKVRFKQETGMSPRQFILRTKIEAACRRLLASNESISKIAHDLGFPTSQYFATVFHRFEGVSPKVYRQNLANSSGPSDTPQELPA